MKIQYLKNDPQLKRKHNGILENTNIFENPRQHYKIIL